MIGRMLMIHARWQAHVAAALLAWSALGCVAVTDTPLLDASPVQLDPDRVELVAMTWNLNWFLDRERGPDDDARQFAKVRDILRSTRPDLIALQEVTSEAGFENLRHALGGYEGVLSRYEAAQKTALLWNDAVFEFRTARSLTGLPDAGRPPLEVSLQPVQGGRELRVCVIHAKAETSASSYAQRRDFANALKAHFDHDRDLEEPNTSPIIVIGDYNDLLLGSLSPGEPSPYRAFIEDRAYAAPTLVLNQGPSREGSYAWGATVDHVIVRHPPVPGSGDQALVLRDELLADTPDFVTAVSDHFPVSVVLRW
jgi:endonuclease/exonuclease/phosphatase family metal-dependent hydrolase